MEDEEGDDDSVQHHTESEGIVRLKSFHPWWNQEPEDALCVCGGEGGGEGE